MNKNILRTTPYFGGSLQNIKDVSNKLNRKLITKNINEANLNLSRNLNWFRAILPSNLINKNAKVKFKETYNRIKFFRDGEPSFE